MNIVNVTFHYENAILVRLNHSFSGTAASTFRWWLGGIT